MKNILTLCLFMVTSLVSFAQDEGTAIAQERLARSNSIYVGVGPALVLGKNLGDYNDGFGFEGGYLKRMNKVISIGGHVSSLKFKYQEFKTYPYYYDPTNDLVIDYSQKGGDISLLSFGGTIKLNLIPVGDNTVFSVYGISTPFLSFVSRKEFVATGDFYADLDGDLLYTDLLLSEDFDSEDIPQLKADSKVSGGLHLGFGAEFFPSKPVSLFIQATFCYTLPIRYSATNSFLKEEDQYEDAADVIYYDAEESLYQDEFPIVNKGFSSLCIKGGISFNF